jgi:hypothetical protein
MKKVVIAATIVFAGVFISGCQGQTASPPNNNNENCPDYTGVPMPNMLDARLAKQIADLYREDRSKSQVNGTSVDDTRSVWFDLEAIKHYIWKIEDTLRKQGCKPGDLKLGLRIYYAKYPDSSRIKEYGVDPSYADHHTIFMVATYKGEKKQIDFDPWNVGKDKCKPLPLSTILQGMGTGRGKQIGSLASYTGQGSGDGRVLNHGGLKPPPSEPTEGVFPESEN